MIANQSRDEPVGEIYAGQEPNSQYPINPSSAINTLSYYRPTKTQPAIAYNQNFLPTFEEFEASYDDENLYNDWRYEQSSFKSPEVEFGINNRYPSNAEYSNGQKLFRVHSYNTAQRELQEMRDKSQRLANPESIEVETDYNNSPDK